MNLISRFLAYLDRPVQQVYSDDPQTVIFRVANDYSTEVVPVFPIWWIPSHRQYRFRPLGWRDNGVLPLLPDDL